jgi:hypothetical protein
MRKREKGSGTARKAVTGFPTKQFHDPRCKCIIFLLLFFFNCYSLFPFLWLEEKGRKKKSREREGKTSPRESLHEQAEKLRILCLSTHSLVWLRPAQRKEKHILYLSIDGGAGVDGHGTEKDTKRTLRRRVLSCLSRTYVATDGALTVRCTRETKNV